MILIRVYGWEPVCIGIVWIITWYWSGLMVENQFVLELSELLHDIDQGWWLRTSLYWNCLNYYMILIRDDGWEPVCIGIVWIITWYWSGIWAPVLPYTIYILFLRILSFKKSRMYRLHISIRLLHEQGWWLRTSLCRRRSRRRSSSPPASTAPSGRSLSATTRNVIIVVFKKTWRSLSNQNV